MDSDFYFSDIVVIYTNISKEIEEKEKEVVVAEAAAEKIEAEEEASTEIDYAEGREEYEQIILDEQGVLQSCDTSHGWGKLNLGGQV